LAVNLQRIEELIRIMIIAIDGPAGAGKGTVAGYLAGHFGLSYLDTGLLYRALAYDVLVRAVDPEDKAAILALAASMTVQQAAGNKEILRGEAVAAIASRVAVIPEVRELLTQLQRDFGHNVTPPYRGAILDGRDIGTVIFPQATCKLFITARPEIRLERRLLESGAALPEQIRQTLYERDQRDRERQVAPLMPATDAIIIDTSDLSIAEACTQAAQHVARCLRETLQ
jgi:cytidylate kinase